ncbi:unnamed protein product, partial [marine sediment metagenome]
KAKDSRNPEVVKELGNFMAKIDNPPEIINYKLRNAEVNDINNPPKIITVETYTTFKLSVEALDDINLESVVFKIA